MALISLSQSWRLEVGSRGVGRATLSLEYLGETLPHTFPFASCVAISPRLARVQR